MAHPSKNPRLIAALEAHRRGFVPLPLAPRDKRPHNLVAWGRTDWRVQAAASDSTPEQLISAAFAEDSNVGVLLGEPSHGLIDVDLDHPKTRRLRDQLLPPTPARSGRSGNRASHYWYIAEPGTLQSTRQHKMPDRSMAVEYRSTGAQTVLPPSIHPSGEEYAWEGEPWGGAAGPAVVNGRVLATQVALLALATVLVDNWPGQGSRHEAYLALAGGLLRHGDGVHPYWERNAPTLIRALAEATHDDDGPEARVAEVMRTTLNRLRTGQEAIGFLRLGEIIGPAHLKQVRYLLAEVESAAGLQPREAPVVAAEDLDDALRRQREEIAATLPEERDPLAERETIVGGTWQMVDLEPYLSGTIKAPEPTVMLRSDGAALMYPGRINMLYGASESGKSWVVIEICLQEMAHGARALYIDFEDEPSQTLSRMMALGGSRDEIAAAFRYIRPEGPLGVMERDRWGKEAESESGGAARELFQRELDSWDPTLIIVDGMSVLYGLHGLDTNGTSATDVITRWLKGLCRNGRTTVVVIDHTGKDGARGSMPIGSQHKVAMVQGALLQVWVVHQPRPGALGQMELIVLKDRPGQVRAVSAMGSNKGKTQVAAVVELDSRTEQTTLTIRPVNPVEQRNGETVIEADLRRSEDAARVQTEMTMESRVLNLFAGDMDARYSARQLREWINPEAVPAGDKLVDAAIKRLAGTARSGSGKLIPSRTGGVHLQAYGTGAGTRYALTVAAVPDLSAEDQAVDAEIVDADDPVD